MYLLGFTDGVRHRVGRRRMDHTERSYKKHFQRGLLDGRRCLDKTIKSYEVELDRLF
jgi:hypothetical protein